MSLMQPCEGRNIQEKLKEAARMEENVVTIFTEEGLTVEELVNFLQIIPQNAMVALIVKLPTELRTASCLSYNPAINEVVIS